MLADDAKSAKFYQNEISHFPLMEIFSGYSAISGLVPNYAQSYMKNILPP